MKTCLAAALLASLLLSGCASDDRAEPMAGDIAHDPVSYVAVSTDTPWKTQWNGRWYYFESETNLEKFNEHPGRYASSKESPERRTQRPVYPHDLQ